MIWVAQMAKASSGNSWWLSALLISMLLSGLAGNASAEADCVAQALQQINSPQNELAITAGPESGQFIFARRGGVWGEPGQASRLLVYDCSTNELSEPLFRQLHSSGDPYFDHRTATLWFTATAGPASSDVDIYTVGYQDGWGQPRRLPEPVNSSADEYSPIPRAGRLYFASGRGGDGNLYSAEQHSGNWLVSSLGSVINADTGEWNLWVTSDERLLIFEASGRPRNISVAGDLYCAQKDNRGKWLPAVPMAAVNAAGSQLNPRKIGQWLVYASTAGENHADLAMVNFASVVSVCKQADK